MPKARNSLEGQGAGLAMPERRRQIRALIQQNTQGSVTDLAA